MTNAGVGRFESARQIAQANAECRWWKLYTTHELHVRSHLVSHEYASNRSAAWVTPLRVAVPILVAQFEHD